MPTEIEGWKSWGWWKCVAMEMERVGDSSAAPDVSWLLLKDTFIGSWNMYNNDTL